MYLLIKLFQVWKQKCHVPVKSICMLVYFSRGSKPNRGKEFDSDPKCGHATWTWPFHDNKKASELRNMLANFQWMVLWNWVCSNIWFTDPHKKAGIISLQHLRGGKCRDTWHAGLNATFSLWGPTWSFQVRPFFLYERPFFFQAQDITARYTWQGWKRPSLWPWVALFHSAVLWLLISLVPHPRMLSSGCFVSLSLQHTVLLTWNPLPAYSLLSTWIFGS